MMPPVLGNVAARIMRPRNKAPTARSHRQSRLFCSMRVKRPNDPSSASRTAVTRSPGSLRRMVRLHGVLKVLLVATSSAHRSLDALIWLRFSMHASRDVGEQARMNAGIPKATAMQPTALAAIRIIAFFDIRLMTPNAPSARVSLHINHLVSNRSALKTTSAPTAQPTTAASGDQSQRNRCNVSSIDPSGIKRDAEINPCTNTAA